MITYWIMYFVPALLYVDWYWTVFNSHESQITTIALLHIDEVRIIVLYWKVVYYVSKIVSIVVAIRDILWSQLIR